MRHIDHQIGVDRVGDGAKAGKIDNARIGRAAGDNQLGTMFFGKSRDVVIFDPASCWLTPYCTALNHLPDKFGLAPWVRCPPAASDMPSTVSPRFDQGEHGALIGLRAGMRLHVGKLAGEQLLGPIDSPGARQHRQIRSRRNTADRVTFGIFVGQHRTLRRQHRLADESSPTRSTRCNSAGAQVHRPAPRIFPDRFAPPRSCYRLKGPPRTS